MKSSWKWCVLFTLVSIFQLPPQLIQVKLQVSKFSPLLPIKWCFLVHKTEPPVTLKSQDAINIRDFSCQGLEYLKSFWNAFTKFHSCPHLTQQVSCSFDSESFWQNAPKRSKENSPACFINDHRTHSWTSESACHSDRKEKQLTCRRENEEAAVPAQTKVNDLLRAVDTVSK